MPLLLTCKSINRSVCRSLYEEIYVVDDEGAVTTPPALTRLATVLQHPGRYAKYVRTLIVVPKPVADQALPNGLLFESFYEDVSVCLGPRQLGEMLSIVENLQALIWASDRSPPPQLGHLANHLCKKQKTLVVRPVASKTFCASNKRWNGDGLAEALQLTRLSVSHLSAEGVRELTSALKKMHNLTHLTVDSQFADDALLTNAGDARLLTYLVVRSNGTKITDRGLHALLEESSSLRSFELNELEGRLSRGIWSNLSFLPTTFRRFQLVYNEDGPHHSWITDHLDDTFSLLELADGELRTFSITTLHAEPSYTVLDGVEDADGYLQVKRTVRGICDDTMLPRSLPSGALKRIVAFGQKLEELELDMYVLSLQEVRPILEACKRLRHLRVHLDAPLSKLFGLSASFSTLTQLSQLSIIVTERYCPTPGIINTAPETERTSVRCATASTPATSEIVSAAFMPELSPASTHGSQLSDHEAISPRLSPSASLRLSEKSIKLAGLGSAFQLVNGPSEPKNDHHGCLNPLITRERAPELCIPPKREIRKVVRRCPTLRIIKWIGRLGKGEWHISTGATVHQTGISFVPVYMLDDEGQGKKELSTGADVEELILARRLANAVSLPLSEAEHEEEGKIVYIARDVREEARLKLASLPSLLLDDAHYPSIQTSRNLDNENAYSPQTPAQPSNARSASLSTQSTQSMYTSQASMWRNSPGSPSKAKHPPIWTTSTTRPYVMTEATKQVWPSQSVQPTFWEAHDNGGTMELNRRVTSKLPGKTSAAAPSANATK